MSKQILNIDELEYMDLGHGDNFEAKFGMISRKIGAKNLGYNLTIVPAGKRAFPAHNHRVNDEMFFILEGKGELRVGNDTYPIRQGDVIACPPGGPETAHQIFNNSDSDLRYLSVSTNSSPEIVEYPDSNKYGVTIELDDSDSDMPKLWRLMMKAESTKVDYWEGED